MKKSSRSIKILVALLATLTLHLKLYSQECVTNEPAISNNVNAIASSNGYYLPVTGPSPITIRILFVFLEVNYTGTISDP